MKTKFVVLTQQRTGSIWLSSIFNQHPNITMLPEIFQHSKRGDMGFYNGNGNIESFINDAFNQEDASIVGFKLMHDQLETYPAIIDVLQRMNVKIIRLKRNNFLDIYISKLIANKNKIWATGNANKLKELRPIHIDTSNIIMNIELLENTSNKLNKIAERFDSIDIVYEELLKDASLIYCLFDFLGAEEFDSVHKDKTKKIVKCKKELISNWSEVEEVIKSSKFSGQELIE